MIIRKEEQNLSRLSLLIDLLKISSGILFFQKISIIIHFYSGLMIKIYLNMIQTQLF